MVNAGRCTRYTLMLNEINPTMDFNEPVAYQIRLKGQLGGEWAEWFGSLSIAPDADGTMLMISPALDQAALHGLIKKVRDLGLALISINPLGPDQAEALSADSSQSVAKGDAA